VQGADGVPDANQKWNDPPEDTGVITNLGRPALEEWLKSEELHRLHAADGSAVTCLNSLLARVQKTKTS
jgi:hypothetical protein